MVQQGHCCICIMTTSKHDQRLYAAVFTCMYHAALRIGEISSSRGNKHTLQHDQIQLVNLKGSKCMRITFSSYKHTHHPTTPLMVHPTHKLDCPIAAYTKYVKLRKTPHGSAFQDISGLPLTRTTILSVLQSCLAHSHLDSGMYNTHSFRIGKTTDLVHQGYSYPKIALIGRWKSNAFYKYIKPQTIHTT